MGAHLSKARKEELSEKALSMSCKGHSVSHIARELEVQWRTANSLVDYALEKRDIDEDVERERSLARHQQIIRYCWEQLDKKDLGLQAQNRPAYIARIQHSISEIDRLNNVTPPLRTQQDVNISYRDYTTGEQLEELFALDRDLDAAWARYQDADSQEPVDS